MDDLSNEQSVNIVASTENKKEIRLPVIALVLSVAPFIIAFLLSFLAWWAPSSVLLLMVLSPIAGLIIGIVSLCKGKKRIGVMGMIFSIISIALPAAIIIFIIVIIAGSSMGLISMM